MRLTLFHLVVSVARVFPFLFGGAFIEATDSPRASSSYSNFPSFWEGLSLRRGKQAGDINPPPLFPFLFGGAFIEATRRLA